MDFKALNLMPQILKAADELGYQTPSPIQEKAIPPVLQKRDLLGCAQTGTGKTAAFAMPILQNLMQTRGAGRVIKALVLTPTRELALQIYESFISYSKYLPIKSCVIFGGVSQNPQVETLKRGVDILVATPGRLNDLISQGFIKLGSIEVFVLDEADRMLDMGFVHDVKKVIKQLPQKRQTLLFSATMPKEIEELASSLLVNPSEIYITPPATTVEKIEQSLYFVDKANKRCLLAELLKDKSIISALVFTRTKHGADKVVRELLKSNIKSAAIHGNKSQNARQAALSSFKNGEVRVLVATDIAARGIDINELSHVINYDLPDVPETYVHRIGRTARAGQKGIAISFCCFDELSEHKDIEKLIGIKIPVIENHEWPMIVLEASPKQTRLPRSQKMQGQLKSPTQKPSGNEKKEPELKNKNKTISGKNNKSTVTISAPSKPLQQKSPVANKSHKLAQAPPMQNIKTSVKAQNKNSSKSEQHSSRDESLRIIAKRSQSQKFASFEDFFKSNK